MAKTQFGSEVLEYLETKRTHSTRRLYRIGLDWFLRYYTEKHGENATLSDFLDRLDENDKLPRREKKRLALGEINAFIDFLSDKGYANNSIRTYFSPIQNFLKYNGFEVSGRDFRLPPSVPQTVNNKHPWKIEEIRAYVNVANNMRDKAIILCLFQSGLSLSDLFDLNYGDVKDELEEGRLPLYLHLYRGKTGEEFKTFFGRDSVKYLRLYLETRKNLKRDSPLFCLSGSDTKRITDGAIQARFRELVKELSFIKDHELKGYNPCRPHSLRSAFRSRLTGKTDSDLIEFFIGHALGGTKRAYLNLPIDDLRELYANSCEPFLAIEKTSRDELVGVAKASGEIREKIEEQAETIRALLKRTQRQDVEAKELRQEYTVLTDRIEPLFSWLDQVGGFFAEVVKSALLGKAYLLSGRDPRLQRFIRKNITFIKQIMAEKKISFEAALNEVSFQGGRQLQKIFSMSEGEIEEFAKSKGMSVQGVIQEAFSRGQLALDYAGLKQTREIEKTAKEGKISFEVAFLETIDDPDLKGLYQRIFEAGENVEELEALNEEIKARSGYTEKEVDRILKKEKGS